MVYSAHMCVCNSVEDDLSSCGMNVNHSTKLDIFKGPVQHWFMEVTPLQSPHLTLLCVRVLQKSSKLPTPYNHGPFSWLCIPLSSVLVITILHLQGKRQIAALRSCVSKECLVTCSVEYAAAQGKIPC